MTEASGRKAGSLPLGPRSANARQLPSQICLKTVPVVAEVRPPGPREGVAGPLGVLRAMGTSLFTCCWAKSSAALFLDTRKQLSDGKTTGEKKGVCVCVLGSGVEGREEGGKKKGRKQNMRKQPNSKGLWFSSCG